jgi:hypothetical protein
MTQIIASKPFCLENSTQLTRTGSEAFYHLDGSDGPSIVDKHQAKRLYRLQQTPTQKTHLHIDNSDVSYETQGYFENIVRKQVNESAALPVNSVYHPATDKSNSSMKRFAFGKARLDPQHTVPNQINTIRDHPTAITILRLKKQKQETLFF